jgi:hypothetical protein
MIVALSRDLLSCFLTPHHSDHEALWLSPGAYSYLLEHTDYKVFEMERVSEYLIQRMQATGHLRPLRDAPPLGGFLNDFIP